MTVPDFDQVIADAAPIIDDRVAKTGRPREIYEAYLIRPLRPGQEWRDALYGRLESLAAGPLPTHVKERLRRQVKASRPQSAKAA